MPINMAPDSHRYLALGAGQKVARPFNRRILLPLLCGDHVSRWVWCSRVSLFLLPLLTGVYVYQRQPTVEVALFATLLMAGMPTVKWWWNTPVLVDTPAFCFALTAAILPWPFNLIVAILGGFCRETVPIFAALYAWNPILLVGLIPVGIYALMAPVGPDQMGRDEWLKHPFRTAQKFKKGKWMNPLLMISPWGAGLIALCHPSTQLIATVTVAYSQLLVATDAVRLYVWAAPVVLLQAAEIDPMWMGLLVVVHWFNPWRGEGY